MTGQREWFTTFEHLPPNSVEVILGDDHIIPATGIGLIKVKLSDGSSHVMQRVLYVPKLRRNLFSLSVVAKNGGKVILEDEFAMVYGGIDKSILLSTGTLVQKALYQMDFKTDSCTQLNSTTIKRSDIDLWHQRLGHTNFAHVQRIAQSDAISGIKISNYDQSTTCIPCSEGKMTQGSFPPSETRATQCAAVVHFDTAGPMQAPSLGGANYMCLFVDDYSAMTFAYIMKHKSEAPDAVKWMIAKAQSDGHRVITFRSDNAKEYFSNDLNHYLLDEFVHHSSSAPRCPQQNGRIERQNRTIEEMVRVFMHSANLPFSLWAELTKTAVYIRNFIPLDRLDFKSPFEIWHGYKPSVKHLRIIGSRALAFVHDDERRTLDKKCDEYVLVGYEHDSRSYRLWKPGTRTIKVAHQVKIIEPGDTYISAFNFRDENRSAADHQSDFHQNESRQSISTTDCIANRTRSKQSSDQYQQDEHLFLLLTAETSYNEVLQVPMSYEEAVQSAQSNEWKRAMLEEINSLAKNRTWILVDSNQCNKTPLRSKWLFKIKLNEQGLIERFKSRLVVKGCSQRAGVDYSETFAPVARFETIRSVISVAASKGYTLRQFDVKTAFLNGDLNEEIYMYQPDGFDDGSGRVCQLFMSLYGLKQAPRA